MTHFILYVKDQNASKAFYKAVLSIEPSTDVPGMTEFNIEDNCMLGLMPESGINKILNGKTADPASGSGIPRCEIYLYRNDLAEIKKRLRGVGAKEISDVAPRDWGDEAGYFADPDGHIIAIARRL